MIKPQTLKGFRDFLPQEARKRQYVISKLKTVFESFGFEPLETPTLEYEEILTGKYGEEGDKLMYRFEDNGQRRVAMRYDQTVPLARVVAQYQNELPMPFKRYQIQPVWRADNTQRGRYREFTQCDIDIVGDANDILADTEIQFIAFQSLRALGLTQFKLKWNYRYIFDLLVKSIARLKNNQIFLEDLHERFKALRELTSSIDKLDKIGKDGVMEEIENNQYLRENLVKDSEELKKISDFLNLNSSTSIHETIDMLEKYFPSEDLKWLRDLNSTFSKYSGVLTPTLSRGLDYYTGLIFEIEIEGYNAGSVCGGGRYDHLIGMFLENNTQIPAVGCAFGFDRIIDAMNQLDKFPKHLITSQVLVTIFSSEYEENSTDTFLELITNNINTEVYLGQIKEKNPLEKQFKYANKKDIPYIIIIGPEEVEKKVVTLKKMDTGEQTQKPLNEIIQELKKDLKK